MARRRFTVIFTVLGFALFVSMAGFLLLYLAVGREPAVSSNSTLVLKVGGDLAEVAPGQRRRLPPRFEGTPTVRAIVDNLRKAKVDARVSSLLLKPTGFESPYWAKVQEIRDAVLDFKKSGKPVYAYLEYGGDREYYLATAADRVFLMPSSPLDLNGVATYRGVPARHARQDRRVSRPAPHRRLQDGVEPAHRKGLHARAQGDGRVAQPRPLQPVRARRRRRAARRTPQRSNACSTKGRFCRRTRCAPGSSTMWRTRTRLTNG